MNGKGEAIKAASLRDILLARDRRAAAQRSLLERYGLPVLSLTLVSPGPVKDSSGRRQLMDMAEVEFLDACRKAGMVIRQRSRVDGLAGPEALWVVETRPDALKRLAVSMEDARPWGRLLDADVIVAGPNRGPVSIGRHLLGRTQRGCLVCGEEAKECIGFRRHHPSEAALVASAMIGRITGMP